MPHGEHHVHQRKRIHLRHQKYPHPDRKIRALDRAVMVVAVAMPLTTIPQIYRIYAYQNATGVSLLMWVLYNISVIPMLLYGIVHKAPPIIVLNALWFIAQITIIIGVIMYG